MMMTVEEPSNIGLSEQCHVKLTLLQHEHHFAEMRDAYRFGIALALSRGVVPPEIETTKANIYGVATIDPDRTIYNAITILMDTQGQSVYKWAERLAEWGVNQLFEMSQSSEIDYIKLIQEAQRNS